MSTKTLQLSAFRLVWMTAVLLALMSYVGEELSRFLQDRSDASVEFTFPAAIPREEDRVRSEVGHSLIAPVGWRTIRADNELTFVPKDRSAASTCLQVKLLQDRYRHPFPLPETHRFQNRPAYSVVRTEQTAQNQPTKQTLYLVIERDENLFELSYVSAGESTSETRENVWRYFDTFRAIPAQSIARIER